MARALTRTQQRILEFIIEKKTEGKVPTLAEIAAHFGYRNRSTVQQHLQSIERKGYIKRNPKISRGIELLTDDKLFIPRPVLGEVAAGNPLTIYPDAIDSVELPTIARMPKDSFLLKVKGDSLKDAYIFTGDVVIVNPNAEAQNGHIVAAVLDDAAVVKRVYKKRDRIELHSENPEYEPIIIDKNYSGFKLVGVVVGGYRSMGKKGVWVGSLFKNKYRIESARLQNWDYGWNGKYFVTIVTKNHKHYFGKIDNAIMILNEFGKIAKKCWCEIPEHFPFVILDEYQIMPNHVHGIIEINKNDDEYGNDMNAKQNKTSGKNEFGPQSKNLGSIIRGYKIGVSKFAKNNNINFKWQPRFHDHIIRDAKSLNNIRNYIQNNPANWKNDKFNQ